MSQPLLHSYQDRYLAYQSLLSTAIEVVASCIGAFLHANVYWGPLLYGIAYQGRYSMAIVVKHPRLSCNCVSILTQAPFLSTPLFANIKSAVNRAYYLSCPGCLRPIHYTGVLDSRHIVVLSAFLLRT